MSKVGTILIDDPEIVNRITTNLLYQHRSVNSWSLRRAALKCNVTPTAISNWELGVSYPTDENMMLIAKAMKVPLDDLKAQWREWYQIKHSSENSNGSQEKSSDGKRT